MCLVRLVNVTPISRTEIIKQHFVVELKCQMHHIHSTR